MKANGTLSVQAKDVFSEISRVSKEKDARDRSRDLFSLLPISDSVDYW